MHSFWSDIMWAIRDISPFAFVGTGLAVTCLSLWLVTKWREFMMIGLTAGIYVVPFLMAHPSHY